MKGKVSAALIIDVAQTYDVIFQFRYMWHVFLEIVCILLCVCVCVCVLPMRHSWMMNVLTVEGSVSQTVWSIAPRPLSLTLSNTP